jgi:CrcB protein
MWKLALIGIGGFVGAVSRYSLGGLVHRWYTGAFPWGTMSVNIFGCVILGCLATLSEDYGFFRPETRLLLFVGVLGGFTTFSTFGLETFSLLREGNISWALLNIGGNVVLGLGGVWLGHMVARLLG